MTKLFIKNMVCNRCIMVVKSALENLNFTVRKIELGEAELKENSTSEEYAEINKALLNSGFGLIDNKKSRIIEKIKIIIIDLVHHSKTYIKTNLSDHLSKELNYDYTYLSNLFSDVEGITIEKYFIAQKIERVKELIVYDELSLSEIADETGYSSVAYLSSQFKKTTGLTPSHFKKIADQKRISLDKL